MAGKVTVGTVYLKVQPDLDGFRRKVEQGSKGLKDVELDVNPDMDGFRQKVKAATKGMKASVDVDANTKDLIRKTEKALADVKRKAKHTARMRLDAEFAHGSADRRIQRFMNKVNATSVVSLKIADLDQSQVSKVSDQIQRSVSRDPVKVRFAAPKNEIAKLTNSIKATLKDRADAGKVAIGSAVLPQAEKAQDKYLKFLDEVRAKRDKLKKSGWEASSPAPLMEYKNADYLADELKRVRDLGRATKVFNKNAKNARYNPKLHQDLIKLQEATKELRGITDRDSYGKAFQKIATGLIQARKGVREADFSFNPLEFRQLRDLSKEYQDATKVVKLYQRTRREIYKDKLVGSKTYQETQKQLGKLREGFDKTATSISRTNDKLQQKIREASSRTETVVRKTQERIKRAASPITRQISLARSIDPGNKLDKTLSGKLINLRLRAKGAAKGLDRFKIAAQRVTGVSREVAKENSRAAKSFTKVEQAAKKANNTGFGGRRRRGLKSIDEVGTERFAGLTRVGWMVAAIGAIAAPVVQLISGLAASLPALGGAALAALGVTLLGLDGIKEAAQAAAPALERAKEAVSGVFETRMTPQFEQLGKLLDNITPQLETMAHGMSDFSQGIVDGLTSNVGETNIQKLLENSAGLFSKMKPFAQDFTEGLLEMAGAGSETFPALADGMNRFGDSFKKNISELASSGELQDAIQATYDVVGNLGMNLGRILREGIATAPSMSRSLEPLLDGLTDGIVDIMPLLSEFSEFVGPTLGAALGGIGDIATSVTPGLSDFFSAITPGAVDLFAGLGEVIGALAAPFADFAGALAPGIGTVLSEVGDGLSQVAETMNSNPELSANMQTLGTALGDLLSVTGSGDGFLGTGKPLISESDVQLMADLAGAATHVLDAIKGLNWGKAIWDAGAGLGNQFGVSSWLGEKLFGPQEEIEFTPLIRVNPTVDLAGSMDILNQSMAEPLENIETAISNFEADAQAVAHAASIDISPQIRILQDATNEAEFTASAQEIINSLQGAIDAAPTEIDPNLKVSSTAPVETVGVADGVKDQVETDINSALSAVDLDMSGTAAAIGSQLGDALGGVTVPMDGLTDQVTSQIDDMVSGVSSSIAEITDIMTSEGANAQAAFVGAMESTSSESVGIAQGMASSIQGALTMDLTSNGASVGNTFAAGLESTVDRVRNAAIAIAAAVDDNMPHSPAKEGPLSGKGWVDTSGIAVGREFAAGMLSQVSYVGNAAGQVTGAVRDEFDRFQANPVSNMESFKRNEVLQPVLESNAKKIADWRKREEERAEKHNERMGKIDEGKSQADKKEEQRVKARESLAKQSAESYEKLLESLETPDYESIDRSFQGYWMDGYSDALKQSIQDAMSSTNVSGALAHSVKQTTALIRDNIGDHPILAQVEANVDSEAFSWAIHNAIEEAGIHEVPINFAVANLNQLKSDLGMGDGVMSRALDQAIQFDPARNDKRRYEEEKTEVHYHVTDMEEAIRLEHKRERLELMRLPR